MIYEVITTEQADADLRGLRVMPVDNYLVFYIPDKKAGIVTVIRVMYAGMNVAEQLENHTVI
jgi:toxin ParE1/3/4